MCDKFFFSLEGGVSGPQVRCLGMQLARSLSERRMCCVVLCVLVCVDLDLFYNIEYVFMS